MGSFDRQIQQAIRERMLEEIRRKQEHQAVVNNIYGGNLPVAHEPNGVSESMSNEIPAELRDYMVEISREDMPDINPATGKPKGWIKKVHRYSQPKDMPEDTPPKKKVKT